MTYRLYRLAAGLRHHVPRQFTPAGLLVLTGLLLAGVASVDMDRTVAYQAFALQFCLLATAFVMKRFFRGKFQVTRHLPRFASVGHAFRYRVEIRNESPKAVPPLEVFEELSDPRPGRREFYEAMRTDKSARSFRLLPRRTSGHRREFRRANVAPVALPPLAARGVAEVAVEATPLRRGPLRFVGTSLARPDPLGLMRCFTRVPSPESILVLPRRYPLPTLVLAGSRKYQPGGVTLAATIGESEEFMSLRDYRPGDPLRHIHWRSWARLGRPIVREYQDEFVPRHALILDTFARASQDHAFEEAVSVAASFACTVDTQESLLDLLFVGPKAICFTSGRGLGQAEQALEILASVQRCPDGSFDLLQHLVLQHAPLVCGCITIFVEWDDRRRELVRRLRALGLPVLVLVVAKSETAFASEPECAGGVHFLDPDRIAEGLLRLEGVG